MWTSQPARSGRSPAAVPVQDLASAGEGERAAALILKCIDLVSDAVLITGVEPSGPRIVCVNAAFERMTGHSADAMTGQSPRFLQGPKTDPAELQRIRAALTEWKAVHAELVNYKRNGDTFCVEMDIVPISDGHGRWTHWVSIQRDVTERRHVQARSPTGEAQRFESLATLSSRIAHDVDNIVAAMRASSAVSVALVDAASLADMAAGFPNDARWRGSRRC